MSLFTALSSGTAGLASAGSDISAVGDNLANSNTIGFKQQRVNFADALAQNVVGASGQIGLGSRMQSVQTIMTEGALQNTGIATDLALQGNGFFQVSGTTRDGRNGLFLTRAGQFTVDNNGFLVTQDGLRVQGYAADAAGNVTVALGDLQVGNATATPHPTVDIAIKANLDADAPTGVWDPTQPAASSNFSTSVSVYDSLGHATQIQIYFRHTTTGWEWHGMADGAAVGGTPGTPVEVAGGTLAFDAAGRLQTVTQSSSFNPAGANAPQPLTFDLGDALDDGGTGLAGITQFASPGATTLVTQDGYGSGQLSAVQIDKSGVVQGVFTNGEMRSLGQVGVARVAAPDALERTGGNLYAVTSGSGDAVMGAAGEGGRAFIAAGTLEQSNVDIADQLVRMITAQRIYEANSKTITTADQLLSELISMKR